MDLDALCTNVRKLMAFQKRVEDLLSAAGQPIAGDEKSAMDRLKDLERFRDELTGEGDRRTVDLSVSVEGLKELTEDLRAMYDWFRTNRDGLEALLAAKTAVGSIPSPTGASGHGDPLLGKAHGDDAPAGSGSGGPGTPTLDPAGGEGGKAG